MWHTLGDGVYIQGAGGARGRGGYNGRGWRAANYANRRCLASRLSPARAIIGLGISYGCVIVKYKSLSRFDRCRLSSTKSSRDAAGPLVFYGYFTSSYIDAVILGAAGTCRVNPSRTSRHGLHGAGERSPGRRRSASARGRRRAAPAAPASAHARAGARVTGQRHQTSDEKSAFSLVSGTEHSCISAGLRPCPALALRALGTSSCCLLAAGSSSTSLANRPRMRSP